MSGTTDAPPLKEVSHALTPNQEAVDAAIQKKLVSYCLSPAFVQDVTQQIVLERVADQSNDNPLPTKASVAEALEAENADLTAAQTSTLADSISTQIENFLLTNPHLSESPDSGPITQDIQDATQSLKLGNVETWPGKIFDEHVQMRKSLLKAPYSTMQEERAKATPCPAKIQDLEDQIEDLETPCQGWWDMQQKIARTELGQEKDDVWEDMGRRLNDANLALHTTVIKQAVAQARARKKAVDELTAGPRMQYSSDPDDF